VGCSSPAYYYGNQRRSRSLETGVSPESLYKRNGPSVMPRPLSLVSVTVGDPGASQACSAMRAARCLIVSPSAYARRSCSLM
jgi:hypothetical protein